VGEPHPDRHSGCGGLWIGGICARCEQVCSCTICAPLHLECPCCGRIGALADLRGEFHDGQDLVCGCDGQVSCDSESEPDVVVSDDCPCEVAGG